MLKIGILLILAIIFWKYTQSECRKLGIGFGFLFASFFTLGRCVEKETWKLLPTTIFYVDYIVYLFGGWIITGGIFSILYQLCKNVSNKFYDYEVSTNKKFIYIYIGMIVCYSFCFWAYFPGCMSYDSWYITLEALGIIGFDNHHPFLHTFVWSIFARMDEFFGIEQIGIILYTLFQMLVMTAIYSYGVKWIFKRKGNRISKYLSFMFYALTPVFHIFTLILTKDVFFSGCFLLFTIKLIEYFECTKEENDNRRNQKTIAVLSLLCCLLRNGMIYVMLLFLLLLLLSSGKKIIWYRGLIVSVIMYFFIVGIVYPSMGVAKGSVKELLSVPLSQIAAVYKENDDMLTEEDKKLIIKYIPDVERYDRFFADHIKTNFNVSAFEENQKEFYSLWFRLLMKSPKVYIKAFLSLNLPSWYPQMDSVREYIETDNYSQDYSVHRIMIFPRIYDFYEDVSENQASWMHWSVFRWIYSIGMPIWILLFWAIWFIVNRRKALFLSTLPGILLWCIHLLGPVSNFRYVEPLLLTYPVWLTVGVEKGTE